MKVSFITLGCRVNSYESDAMAGLLRARGFEVVPEGEFADVYVVNTCTVTNIADRKSRQMVSKCRRINPNARVVVTGCWSQRFPEEAAKLPGVCLVLGSAQKNRIADYLEGIDGPVRTVVGDVMHAREFEELSASAEGRTRAYLKIQDGCSRFCSYCAIPFARGAVRSRSLDSVRRELEKLDSLGFAEVVLTGIHLTDYGRDLDGPTLADAIDCANGLDSVRRIRLGSLEPHGLTDEMISRITANPKVCRQFHLSLQSGSDTVLERMRRGYTAGEYEAIVSKIRAAYGQDAPRVAITTDVIAGFAGETEEEHNETLAFVRRIGFARMHVFPYSRRSGTRADLMPGQLTNAQKAARAQELISVGREMEREFLRGFIGRDEQVLLETRQKDGLYSGYTDSYVRVCTAQGEPDTLVSVHIDSVKEDTNGEMSLLSHS